MTREWDERYDPKTGEWTCPCCLNRRHASEGSWAVITHLCDECSKWVCSKPEPEKPSGLRWTAQAEGWYLERRTTQFRVTVARVTRDGDRWVCETLYEVECRGTLADCARAVVEAVR